jgi:HSP20 family protein
MSSMITRWDPFRELSTLQDRMNRLFQESMGPHEQGLATPGFTPPVDIYEDEHNINIRVEVPGIEQKDIDVQVENNTLTIRGERKFEKDQKEENFHRIERRYGSFMRSFTLPNTVDTEKVSANYENGVLEITLPKRAEAKPKQIKVNVGGQKQIETKGGKAA